MIGQKVLDLCKLKGVTLRAACQASGLKYSTLHAQISNNRPIPFMHNGTKVLSAAAIASSSQVFETTMVSP